MIAREFDDETLMAFADGELDDETAAAIEEAMEANVEFARRVALFLETRVQAKEALRPLLEEPVPEALSHSVQRMIDEARQRSRLSDGGKTPRVVAFKARTKPPTQLSRRSWILPLAASLVAVLFGIGGYLIGVGSQDLPHGLEVAGLNSPALSEALGRVASGDQAVLAGSNDRIRVIATFRDETGSLCREFEIDSAVRSTVISVACRSNDAWAVNFAVVAPAGDGGYAPASSMEALDAYVATTGADAPLSREDEAAALRRLDKVGK